MDDADTIAAIATPLGVGGIGVVRVSGPRARQIAQMLCGRSLPPRRACLVRFLDADNGTLDEGIALLFSAPRSYTGEDVLELQGHGGPVVVNQVLRRCLDLGARLAEAGEFTKRAFLNGRLDLAQAEAVADLIVARTDQAAKSAARTLTGEFSRRVARFQEELTALRVLLEGALDFPEEGIDFIGEAGVRDRLQALVGALVGAERAGTVGKILREGISIALVGPPNSGKSSIINALCEDDVAIVTSIPGTTRDLVKEVVQIDGVPVQVVDTAGLRLTADPVEELGIARTWGAVAAADVVVVVLDASSAVGLDADAVGRLPTETRRIWAHNKIDLVGRPSSAESRCDGIHIWLSARTGAGLGELRRALVSFEHEGGDVESAFAARERQLRALRSAREFLGRAVEILEEPEIAAEELRLCQEALSEITGEVVADDILGEIFAKFCIGK
jgi:tRNA modification GTPase